MATKKSTLSGIFGWSLPFSLALLFHILVIASALIVPKYLKKQPVIPEFSTVDLVNVAAPLPLPVVKTSPPPSAAPKTKVTIRKLQPVETRKTAPIAAPVAEKIKEIDDIVVAPVKTISINPLKQKKKKILPPDTSAKDKRLALEAELKKQQQALQIRRQQMRKQQLLEDAQRKKALEDAESAAASEAVNALKNMLQADADVTSSSLNAQTTTVNQGGGSSNIIESQYQATIFSSLQEHWALPDIKPWNSALLAVVVIHIAKNGQIIQHSFEKRSGDRVFDQFVSRTIQEANPLPAIPAAMRVETDYRIGLRFKPGQIQ